MRLGGLACVVGLLAAMACSGPGGERSAREPSKVLGADASDDGVAPIAEDAGDVEDASDEADVRAVVGAGMGAMGPLLPWALNQILATGQSTGVGAHALPIISSGQPYRNVQGYDTSGAYNINNPNTPWAFRPLVALPSDRNGSSGTFPYPANLQGESPDVRMANQLAAWLAPGGFPALITSCVGEAGQPMSVIMKGGTGNAYAAGIFEAAQNHKAAVAAGLSHGVLCTVLDHGQADDTNAGYGALVIAMQSEFQTDIQALWGQTRPIPMLVMQQNSAPLLSPSQGQNLSGLQELSICLASPSTLVPVGPSYQFPPYTDNVHFTAPAEVLRGELLAFVLWQLLSDQPWLGLTPKSVTRSGNDVTVAFNVPLGGSLVIDTASLNPPHQTGTYAAWAAGMGLEAWHGGFGGTIVGISSITVGAQSIVVHCASQPDTIGLAHTPDIQGEGQPGGGRVSNIRGSVAHPVGLSGVAQYDWAWEFSQGGL